MFSCASDDRPEAAGSPGCLCCRGELQSLTRRINADLSRRGFVAGIGGSLAALGLPRAARAQSASNPTPPTVFTNFLLFDGKSNALRGGLALIVEGGRIKAVATGDTAGPEGSRTIDCGGRVVMPGLIDAHWHSIFAALPIPTLLSAELGYTLPRRQRRGGAHADARIHYGAGPRRSVVCAQAGDRRRTRTGTAHLSVRGHDHHDRRPWGHASPVRPAAEPGRPGERDGTTGAANIADSADEVRLRVREQLLEGASQIKLVGGGGVSSPRTTLDMLTFSEPELRAGVEAAADRNTYVAVHAYPPAAIQRAIAAGVQCIEHGHLMDEATAKLMADKGIWLSTQPFIGEDDTVPLSGQSRINLLQVIAGTNTAYPMAKEYKLKTAFGSDMLFSAQKATRQGIMLTHLKRWYENAEILKMATGTNGELLALSGPRNPYPGKLGIIEEGAFADLLVVDGDPIANIALVENPETNFLVIMKGGKIYKDTLRS